MPDTDSAMREILVTIPCSTRLLLALSFGEPDDAKFLHLRSSRRTRASRAGSRHETAAYSAARIPSRRSIFLVHHTPPGVAEPRLLGRQLRQGGAHRGAKQCAAAA